MTPLLRNMLVLTLTVTLGGAPLARSLDAPGNAECAAQQADVSDDGCCGDGSPGAACAVVCPAGGCALIAEIPQVAWIGLSVLPTAFPPPRLATQVRAPDTAPPKRSHS